MRFISMNHASTATRTYLLLALRLSVVAASVVLVLVISWDTFNSMSFTADPFYLRLQKWICYFFLLDIAVEWAMSPRKLHYLWSNVFFIAVSIPWASLTGRMGWHLPDSVAFAVRFMPMIRAACVLAMLTGDVTRSKATSLFTVYMTLLGVSLYFGALMFFIEEHPVNPGVDTFWSALWWAVMDMTTCGSSIEELTTTGRALGVILAAEGLMLFPVFTVYLTNALTRKR